MKTNRKDTNRFFHKLILGFAFFSFVPALQGLAQSSAKASASQNLQEQAELQGQNIKGNSRVSGSVSSDSVDSIDAQICREQINTPSQNLGGLNDNEFGIPNDSINCGGSSGGTTGGCTCPTPNEPLNPTTSNLVYTGVDLSWTEPSGPKTGYQIRFKRSSNNQTVGSTTSVGLNPTMASLPFPSAVQAGDEVFLEIRTANACGGGCSSRYSAWEATADFMVPEPPDTQAPTLSISDVVYPTPPGGFFVSSDALNQISASDNVSTPANITIVTSYQGDMSYSLDLSVTDVTYSIAVTATDEANNSANGTLTVSILADSTQPTIQITGGTLVLEAQAGEEATAEEIYNLGGFEAVDQPGNIDCVLDGSTGCTLSILGTPIDLSQPGLTQITYVAEDDAGNTTTRDRNVDVQDQQAPTIYYDENENAQLDPGEDSNQAPAVSLQLGDIYTEAQALTNVRAVDDTDSDVEITVDVSTPGYSFPLEPADSVVISIVYTATDDAGLTDTMARNINFQAPTSEPVLLLINPIADQVGVGIDPTFQWEVGLPSSADPADFSFTYNFRLGVGDSCAEPDLIDNNEQNNIPENENYFNLPDGLTLENDGRQYTWCVEVLNNGQPFIPFTPASFNTQEINIPTLDLSITPFSGNDEQTGEQSFVIRGEGGESAPSEAVIYRVVGGAIDSLPLASIPMNPNGTFNYETSVSDIDSNEDYSFVAQVKRGSEQFGEFSNIVTHYYDPALSVPAPVVTNVPGDNGLINIEFEADADIESYKVWRRVALELCNPNEPGVECYQGMKPFKKIGEQILGDTSTVTFQDTNYVSGMGGDDGVSYFVTAHAGNRSSRRSNSVSKGDVKEIDVIEEPDSDLWATPRPVFYGPPEGDRIETYLCDMDAYLQDNGAPQPYGVDNSADLSIEVFYAQKNPEQSCDQFGPDELQNFETGGFDSLSRVAVPQAGINTPSCVLAHTRFIPAPGLSYCHSVCVYDQAGNQNCLEGVTIEGDGSDDLVQPDFDGIDELYAGDDGQSLLAKWDPAEGSNDAELILYELQYTSSFNADGSPDFSDAVSKNLDPSMIQHSLSGLESDKKYAVRVLAIDDDISQDASGAIPGANKVKSKTTLNNFPVIQNLQVSQASGRGGYANLKFDLYDRNVAFGETHVLKSVKVRPASQSELLALNDLQGRSVTRGLAALSAASTPGEQVQENEFTFNFTDVLTPGDLDKPMYIEVEVEDTSGLIGVGQAVVSMNEQNSANSQRIGGAGLSCGVVQSPARPWSLWICLMALIAMSAFIRIFRKEASRC